MNLNRPRCAIDLNVRVEGNGTYCGFEDIDGDLDIGGLVEPRCIVYERESGVEGPGMIRHIDFSRRLVFIHVWWNLLAAPVGQYLPLNDQEGAQR